MRTGPPPKPSAQKRLEGNPGKRKLNENEPQPKVGCDVPAGLLVGARAVWDELYPDLFDVGIITEVDGPAFACLCDSIARWRRAMNALIPTEENPFPEYTRLGEAAIVRLSMAEHLRRESFKEIKAMGPEFGITPSGRSRISVPKREGSKLKKLMGGDDPN